MILLNIFESCNGRTPWELLLWLLGAFILGYLLHYFLERNKNTTIDTSLPPSSTSNISFSDPSLSPSLFPPPVVPVMEPIIPSRTIPRSKKDDLTKVEGIGPKINGLLNNAGIYTFKELSEAKFETLKSILHDAGERYRIHDPTTWPKQAGLADEGKWDELKVLQDHLKGGREG